MSKVGGLLSLASISQGVAEAMIFKSFLAGIAIVVGLAVIGGILAAAIILGGLYASYLVLLQHGLEPQTAILTVAVTALLLIALAVSLIKQRVKNFLSVSRLVRGGNPITSRVTPIMNAFIDGFLDESKPRKQTR